MTDREWCDKLEPTGFPRSMVMLWRFRFLVFLRSFEKVDADIAARAAHAAAILSGLYED